MPINNNEWEELDIFGKKKKEILNFLKINKDKAYSTKELTEIFKLRTIKACWHHLSRLFKEDKFEKSYNGVKCYYKYKEEMLRNEPNNRRNKGGNKEWKKIINLM